MCQAPLYKTIILLDPLTAILFHRWEKGGRGEGFQGLTCFGFKDLIPKPSNIV